MKHIVASLTVLYIILGLILSDQINTRTVAVLLFIATIIITKERFFSRKVSVYFLAMLLILVALTDGYFIALIAIAAFYCVFYKVHRFMYIVLLVSVILGFEAMNTLTIVWIINGGVYGYVMSYYVRKEQKTIKTLDEERRLRHELEATKQRLLQSQDEIEYLTEVKERNRIAREIHDSVGHNIAGVLFQLQAASKVIEKDTDAAKKMVDDSATRLSETLTLTRDTVYNLVTETTIGISQIKLLIDEFDYCPVHFEYKGNFNQLSPKILWMLNNIIKETLTNASKHSYATSIHIMLEMNEYFIRFVYHDNGVGGTVTKVGLGLTAIKERIENVNGTMVISGDDGFKIVCNIPR